MVAFLPWNVLVYCIVYYSCCLMGISYILIYNVDVLYSWVVVSRGLLNYALVITTCPFKTTIQEKDISKRNLGSWQLILWLVFFSDAVNETERKTFCNSKKHCINYFRSFKLSVYWLNEYICLGEKKLFFRDVIPAQIRWNLETA